MARTARAAVRSARRELRTARADLDRQLGTPTATGVSRIAVVATVVVVVVAAVAAAAVIRRTSADHYDESDFRTAARTVVSMVLLPDARDPERARAILDASTGTFRDEFAQSTGAYESLITRLGTVATGSVDGVAVADRAGDAATVLVTAVVASRTDGRDPAVPSRFRLRTRIEPDDGQLKLAALVFLP